MFAFGKLNTAHPSQADLLGGRFRQGFSSHSLCPNRHGWRWRVHQFKTDLPSQSLMHRMIVHRRVVKHLVVDRSVFTSGRSPIGSFFSLFRIPRLIAQLKDSGD